MFTSFLGSKIEVIKTESLQIKARNALNFSCIKIIVDNLRPKNEFLGNGEI